MLGNFDACVNFTLSPLQDGQPFHKTPGDAGGATAYGITHATLARWRRCPVTDDEMKAMSIEEAKAIYRAWYYDTVAGDSLPAGVDLMVFDFGVTAGETVAAKELQRALLVKDDGQIGPITIAAVKSMAPGVLISNLRLVQTSFYRQCSGFPLFGNGWLARVERRAAAAHAMAAAARA
jgi:lysozyme family protein